MVMDDKRYDPVEIEPDMVEEPAVSPTRTVFSPAQVELLNAVASLKSDEEVNALRHAISEFFADRADKEMERLWQSGLWNEDKLKELRHSHYRTPYSNNS